MRSRLITTVTVALFAAAILFAADEQMCSSSARECEQAIRQMMRGRRYFGAELEERKPGLVVKSIFPNGPAHRGGVAVGDRLIAVNGKPLTLASAREFKQSLAEARQTGRLFLIVERRGAYRKLDVLLLPYSKEQIDKIVAAHLTQSHTATAGGQ